MPTVQMLHCLRAAGEGGETGLVDGFAAAFEVLPHARDAVAVRRWDDEAKDPAVTPPPFAHFEPLLSNLLAGT